MANTVYAALDDFGALDDMVIAIASGNFALHTPYLIHEPAFFHEKNGGPGLQFPDVERVRMAVGNGCYDGSRVATSGYFTAEDTVGQRLSCIAPGGGVGSLGAGDNCIQDPAQIKWAFNFQSEEDPRWFSGPFGGTSSATPHVAAIAALLFSDDPSLAGSEVKEIIEQSSIDVLTDDVTEDELPGWDKYTGYGYANAHRAMIFPMIASPSSAGTFWAGDTVHVEWRKPHHSTSLDTCSVYVSLDGKETSTAVLTGSSNGVYPGTYDWIIPDTVASAEAYLWVRAQHDEGGTGDSRYVVADTTDNALTIRQPLFGYVTSDTTWSDRAVIGGDVIIPEGTILTIAAGTIVRVMDGDILSSGLDHGKTELRVFGQIDVQGCDDSRVVFTSAEGSPSEGDWWGIFCWGSNSKVFEYADVRCSTWGLVYSSVSEARVEHCAFSGGVPSAVEKYLTSSPASA